MEALVSIQRVATRYILDYPHIKFDERYITFNLWPLSFLEHCADVNVFKKHSHELYEVQ